MSQHMSDFTAGKVRTHDNKDVRPQSRTFPSLYDRLIDIDRSIDDVSKHKLDSLPSSKLDSLCLRVGITRSKVLSCTEMECKYCVFQFYSTSEVILGLDSKRVQ